MEMAEHIRARVELTVSCGDADHLAKVDGAGEIHDGVQVMHCGVRIEEGCYHGEWMTEIIRRLRGHHEPQEETVVHAILERLAGSKTVPVVIELGAFWAYYSLWALRRLPGARAILVEPDPHNLEVGRRNFALNGCQGEFRQASLGSAPSPPAPFVCESDGLVRLVPTESLASILDSAGLDRVDIVFADIQGAELSLLEGARPLLSAGRARFLVISTHHHTISGDPLIHQRCLALLKALGGHIIAEHTVAESFSGDGLIAASFDDRDRELVVPVSRARPAESLFGDPLHDVARLMDELAAASAAPSPEPPVTVAPLAMTVGAPMPAVVPSSNPALPLPLDVPGPHEGNLAVHCESIGWIPVRAVTYLGHPFVYPPASQVGQAIGRAWEWDAVLRPILEALVRIDAPLICEVGTNIGASLLEILMVKPRARIISFEPSDLYRAILMENLGMAGFTGIEVMSNLVGRTSGKGFLYTDETSGSMQDLPHYTRRQQATVVTLDQVMAGQGRVRFIKVDTDGHDLEVLRGATTILERDHPTLFFEFCPSLMLEDPAPELAWLQGMGYPELLCFDHLGDAVGVTTSAQQAVEWSIDHGYCDILAAAEAPGWEQLVEAFLSSSRHTRDGCG